MLSAIATFNTQETTSLSWVSRFGANTAKRDLTIDGWCTDNTVTAFEYSINSTARENILTATVDGDWVFRKGGNDVLVSSKGKARLSAVAAMTSLYCRVAPLVIFCLMVILDMIKSVIFAKRII